MNLKDQVFQVMLEKRITKPTHYEFLCELIKDEFPAYREESIRRALRKLGELELLYRVKGHYAVPRFMLTFPVRAE